MNDFNDDDELVSEAKPEKRGPGRPRKDEITPENERHGGADGEFWKQAFLVFLQNFQVKTDAILPRCAILATEATRIMKNKIR